MNPAYSDTEQVAVPVPRDRTQVTTGLADSNKMQGKVNTTFYYVGLTKSRTYSGVSIGRRSRTVRVISCRPDPSRSGFHSDPLYEATEATATP